MELDPLFPAESDATGSAESSAQGQDLSDGTPNSALADVPNEDYAWLLWAPRNHRFDIRPVLRFLVSPSSGTNRDTIKYLTLQQHMGSGIDYTPDFFTTELFKESEPLCIRKGDWNQGNTCFFKLKGEDEGDESYSIDMQVFDEEYKPLPHLVPEAIWAGKPKIEYVDLSHHTLSLRPTAPIGCTDRIEVVSKEDFHSTVMVMKIWPSPMCNQEGIEKEMMAYRACDGKGLTPKFLGHVAEEDRVVGMLIEYIQDAHKPSNDEEKEMCRKTLARFHRLTGWHRNPLANHKDNFLIKDDCAYIIDLSMAYTPADVASKGHEWAEQKV